MNHYGREVYKSGWLGSKGLVVEFQWMNIHLGSIPTPDMLLQSIFLAFVSLHLPRPNYKSLNAA